MQASDFFDQIDLALHIQTPAGNADCEIRIAAAFRHQLKAQLLQNAENFVGLEFLAKNAVHFRKTQSDGSQVQLPRHCIDRSAVQLAACRFKNERSYSIAGLGGGFEISASFEAMRRIGVQPVAARTLADRRRIEPCGLDEDVLRLLRDHGVESAHDSGERDWLHCVRDDQIFRRKLALDSIQRFQSLAAERTAHQNLAAFEQIEIEDMRGMSHLPQRVVGGVGGIVDGPLIDQHQPLCDCIRRWL